MKKLLLIICTLLSVFPASAALVDTSNPLVVEGRTWWYWSFHYCNTKYAGEIGLRIGAPEEIDGQAWNPLECVSYGEYIKEEKWVFDKTPKRICYLREEDGKVWVRYDTSCGDYPIGMGQIMGNDFHQLCYTADSLIMQLYDFRADLNSEITFGPEELEFKFTTSEIKEIVNSERHYKCFVSELSKIPDCDDEYYSPHVGWKPFEYIEGIGTVDDIFIMPYPGLIADLGGWDLPMLRYVTDPDGTIIFEAEGGRKLWEMEAGIEEISSEVGEIRWYNLQGIEIDAPTAPGFYIRSQSGKNEKVRVQ